MLEDIHKEFMEDFPMAGTVRIVSDETLENFLKPTLEEFPKNFSRVF